jgi:hypothetical protein
MTEETTERAVHVEVESERGPVAPREIQQPVLLVSSLQAAHGCAEEIRRTLRCEVDVAESRKSAMAALRRGGFAAIVVDDGIAEVDSDAADQLWNAAGLAVPVQVNFALCSAARVTRELRAALNRRTLEEARARKAAENNLQADIGSALTGIVLELDLLRESRDIPEEFRERLAQVAALTTDLRKRLVPAVTPRVAVQAALGAVKLGLRNSAARSALEKEREAARAAGVATGPAAPR